MTAARARARWMSLTGTSAAVSTAVAMLVLGCVLVAVAAPRQSLGLRTRALRATLSATTPLARSVRAGASYSDFDTLYLPGPVPAGDLVTAAHELRSELTAAGLPLRPAAEDWDSLTSQPDFVTGAGPGAYNGVPPELEVIYSDALARHVRVTAGTLPAGPLGRLGQHLGIAVTGATARRFGLKVGSRLRTGPGHTLLVVTAIVQPTDPRSAFWTADPAAAEPLRPTSKVTQGWQGAAFAGPEETDLMQTGLNLSGGQLTWDYPLALGGLTAAQAAPLLARLEHTGLRAGRLSLSAGTQNVTVGPAISTSLSAFVTTDAALAALLSLLFVSLTVIGLVVVLLAARIMAERRRPELALFRARGASRPQIAWLVLMGSAVTALPAALAGAGLAVALTPGNPSPLGWWLAGVTLLAALAAPALIAVRWPDGTAGNRATGPQASRAVAARRWAVEGTLVLLAAGGLTELRQQGLPAGGSGLNIFISAAPVLVAVPAAVIVIRLSPLVLRGLLRAAAARPGVTAFVGLARAARAALAATLPAFALVLALTVVAFGFMFRGAVLRGQVAQSWRVAGADAVVDLAGVTGPVTPAVQRMITAVPGVRHAATAAVTTAVSASGDTMTVVLVSPAPYAALTAATPFPRLPLRRLAVPPGTGRTPASAVVPVLASPSVAATLPPGTSTVLTSFGKLHIRIAGTLTATPAVPGAPDFIVVPAPAAGRLRAAPPTELLVTGPSVSHPALTAAVRRAAPQATVSYRSAVLAGLASAPQPHGAYLAFAEGSFVAAGFSVLILMLALVLAARSRALTLAQLATMGLGPRQARQLVMVEALPPVLAAAVAGTACAVALVPLLAPVLDLSVFTGSAAAVQVRADVAALVIPAAGLIVLGVATLSVQAALSGRRRPASALRINR